jgi:hypothetical protein
MKKKYRDIIVDDILYAWTVVPVEDDGLNLIRIWLNKKIIHEETIPMYDGDNKIEITPLMIAEIIGDLN